VSFVVTAIWHEKLSSTKTHKKSGEGPDFLMFTNSCEGQAEESGQRKSGIGVRVLGGIVDQIGGEKSKGTGFIKNPCIHGCQRRGPGGTKQIGG